MEQTPELREAHEFARAVQDGLQHAHVLKKQSRIATQELAQLRDSGRLDLEAVRTINQKLSKYAFASANGLKKYRPTPAQPSEAQHVRSECA